MSLLRFIYKIDRPHPWCSLSTYLGLGAGIMTHDIEVGLKAARKLQSGCVVINGQSMYRNLQTPWGGYKMSGGSRDGQTATLLNMMQIKNIVLKNLLPVREDLI